MVLMTAASVPSVTDWISGWGTLVGAAAAVATAVVAVIAAVYTKNQWLVARTAREDAREAEVARSQPYVSVFAETTGTGTNHVDLVVRNFGVTAATNILVEVGQIERATMRGTQWENFTVPVLPYLAPGQEWRTFWDTSAARVGQNLPDRYEGTVVFSGLPSPKRPDGRHEFKVVLDLTPYHDRLTMQGG